MPSPFPGMDPYLEEPMRWRGVHNRLIGVLGELLARQVGPRFFVDSDDDMYIIAPDDPGRSVARPDIYLAETEAVAMPRRDYNRIGAPVIIQLPKPITVRYSFLFVRDTADRSVVATIRLLSPVNKVTGSKGRRNFLRKRWRALSSEAHWIEIDLLRGGERTREVADRGDYYAALHRADIDGKLEAWFFNLGDELPTIAVPLVDSLPDVPLDLQTAIETVFERYSYDMDINYAAEPPPPPLSEADAAWAAERIRRWETERGGANGR